MELVRRRVINGKSGFGKTYLAKTLLAPWLRRIVVEQRPDYDGQIFTEFDALADYCAAAGSFRAVWRGGQEFAEPVFELAHAIWNLELIVEEADYLECELGTWFYESIFRGRDPQQIGLTMLVQRPQQLHAAARSQITDVYTFNTSEPGALDWLKVFFPREAIAELPFLPPKHGWQYSIQDNGPPIVQPFQLP